MKRKSLTVITTILCLGMITSAHSNYHCSNTICDERKETIIKKEEKKDISMTEIYPSFLHSMLN
jgi:hypothetical protein